MPATPPPLSAALRGAIAAVAQFLVADAPLGTTLHRIAEHARAGLTRADAVGVTLLDDRGRPRTRVYTEDFVRVVDQAQYDDDAGPCMDALRAGRIIRVEDVTTVATYWPGFSHAATRCGVRSTLSTPLTAGQQRVGVMNLYSRTDPFSEPDEAEAELFATQAAAVLANSRAYWDATELAVGLQKAMDARAVIDIAKGKIMAQNGCTPDEAFQLLVKASQRQHVKVREMARRIVDAHAVGAGGHVVASPRRGHTEDDDAQRPDRRE